MQKTLALLVIALFAVAHCHDVDGVDDKTVILTTANFDEHIKPESGDAWFVMFYAPWCGHCKKAMPEWYKYAANQPREKTFVGRVDWYFDHFEYNL
jgi:thiol-disulfide isomerase/thioredoxin